VKGISPGKKLSIKNLALPMPGEENEWFWSKVNMSGLTPSCLVGTRTYLTGSFVQ